MTGGTATRIEPAAFFPLASRAPARALAHPLWYPEMLDTKQHFVGELFRRHKRELFAYLARNAGRENAPDLLQDTFARALRCGELAAVTDPPAFLQRIATNLARDFARRRKTEAAHLEFCELPEDAPSSDAPADEGLAHRERLRLLRAATETLPPRCREVFVMAAFEDVPLDEIARRLDVSRNMVEKHMRLALQRCRAALR